MPPDTDTRFAPAIPSIFLLMTVVFLAMMPRMLIAPLLLRVASDFGMTYGRASLFFLSGTAGFISGLLVSGYVAQILTHRWTIVVSVFLVGVGLIGLSQAQSPALFHMLLFLAAAANGLYPGSGIAAVTTIAPDIHRGKALSIHECGPNLTFIMAPVLSAAIAPALGWRGVVMIVGAAAILGAGLYAAGGHRSPDRGHPPSFRNLAELARNRSFWIISALFMVGFTAAAGVYAVLPTYLMIQHGLRETLVNTLVGASRIAAFVTILLAGAFVDRFGFRRTVSVILAVTGAVTLLIGVAHGWLLIVAVFAQPILVGAFFPVGLSALAGVTMPERRNLAVALAIPLANLIGSGLVPPLFAAAGERGWFSQAFMTLGIVVIASVALLPLMRGYRRPGASA